MSPEESSEATGQDRNTRTSAADAVDRPLVPWPLRQASAWSGRLLVVGAAVYAGVILLARVRLLTLAMAAAILLTALLLPAHQRLRQLRLPAAAAALGTLLLLLAVLGTVGVFVWRRVASQFDSLQITLVEGLDHVRDWLVTGPLQLSSEQIDQLRAELTRLVTDDRSGPAGDLVGGAAAVLRVATGVVLTLFVLFFLLKDGPVLWDWIVRLFAPRLRPTVHEAGVRSWTALTSYVRGTIVVALADAVLIGGGLLLLRVPLVLPLALLTFLGAFVPLVGATVAGAAAVLVALVTRGVVPALLVLGVVILAQQVEGNILQPLVMNRALRIHPLPLAAAVTTGTLFAGIAGAVVAVPVLAVCYHVGAYLSEVRDTAGEHSGGRRRWRTQRPPSGRTDHPDRYAGAARPARRGGLPLIRRVMPPRFPLTPPVVDPVGLSTRGARRAVDAEPSCSRPCPPVTPSRPTRRGTPPDISEAHHLASSRWERTRSRRTTRRTPGVGCRYYGYRGTMFFHSWTDLGHVVLAGAITYLALVLLLRLSGKRTLAKMNAFDLVVTVALGSTLATVPLSAEVSLAEGVSALAVLVGAQFVVAALAVRSGATRHVVKATPTLLVWQGQLLDEHMLHQRVTEGEVRQSVRSQGIGTMTQVGAVILETDGTFSVIRTSAMGDHSALVDVSDLERRQWPWLATARAGGSRRAHRQEPGRCG